LQERATGPASARTRVRAENAYAESFGMNGTVTKVWLQGAGEPTRVEVQPIGGALQVTTTSYNADFQPLSVGTSPLGGTRGYSWTNGLLMSTSDPSGSRQFTYGPYGQVLTVSSDNVLQQTNHYSGPDSTLDYSVVGKDTTHYTWDGHGRLTGTSDRLGRTTSVTYENSGFYNTYQTTAASFYGPSTTVTFAHDSYGRTSSVTDGLGNATTFGYDLLNRVTSTTQPGSATTSTSYTEDRTGHTLTTTVTDPRSLTFSQASNAVGWGRA
jgi:YD repeat-containing protein